MQSDALLLGSAQITAAKIITGCIKTTANDAGLKDISSAKLSARKVKQILLRYCKMFGMASTNSATSHLKNVLRFITIHASQ